jgi:hypothetical protein
MVFRRLPAKDEDSGILNIWGVTCSNIRKINFTTRPVSTIGCVLHAAIFARHKKKEPKKEESPPTEFLFSSEA